MEPLVEVKGIVAVYAHGRHRIKAVNHVTLSIHHNETLGIVGESGSGKTTLGKIITGLERPRSGSLYLKGRRAEPGLRREIQMVFQDSAAALNPRLSVGSLVEEGLLVQKAGNREERQRRVQKMLADVGLGKELLTRYPHQLSGGQRQRVALARTLVVLPEVVVLDEPVSALDVTTGARLLLLLAELKKAFGLTYVLISHNLAVVRQICDRVAVMYMGKIVEVGAVSTVFTKPQHPYTRLLIDAHPQPDPRRKLPVNLPGEPGDPFAPPSGCRFHPRCKRSDSRCRCIPPGLTLRNGHLVACHYAG